MTLNDMWDKITKTESCWLWIGAYYYKKGIKTYGKVVNNGRFRKAHIVIYEHLIGPIKCGFDLHHTCTNKSCVNPAHLEQIEHGKHSSLTQTESWKINYKLRCQINAESRLKQG